MKYFVPISDERLFNELDLNRYRLVPYHPDYLHVRSVRKALRRSSRTRKSQQGDRRDG